MEQELYWKAVNGKVSSPTNHKQVGASIGNQQESQFHDNVLSQNSGKNGILFEAIQSNLQNPNASLQKLHLINLNISMSSWRKLARGIESTTILKKLKLNRINFEKDQLQLEILVEAISRNHSIELIDLSCNDLTDRYGSLVAQFV